METIRLKVYRYNPDTDAKPYMQDYELEIEPTDVKLLDAIMKLKAKDDSLSFRRSCREGICGSDGMNITGKNGLACLTDIRSLKQPIVLPLLLVESRQIRRPIRPLECLPLHCRHPRHHHQRTFGQPQRPLPPVPLPHHHELRRRLPQTPQPHPRHRQDQRNHAQTRGIEDDLQPVRSYPA